MIIKYRKVNFSLTAPSVSLGKLFSYSRTYACIGIRYTVGPSVIGPATSQSHQQLCEGKAPGVRYGKVICFINTSGAVRLIAHESQRDRKSPSDSS